MSHIPPSLSSVPEWQRIVANAVNPMLQGYPFLNLDSDPGSVNAGFVYYNTTTNKLRCFDGTLWNDLF